MTTFQSLGSELRNFTAKVLPEHMSAELARFAKSELARVISSGQASPVYDRYVNNVRGLPEEAVKMPNAILYVFSNWSTVINAALGELRKRVRSKSGRYSNSFIVIVGGRQVTDYASIRPDEVVIIVNYQPFTRRLDNTKTASRRHFLNAYHALRRRFGQTYTSSGPYDIKNVYLNIGRGAHPMIPYVLKGDGPRAAAASNSRSSIYRKAVEGGGPTTGLLRARRKGTEAGQPISYPALVIRSRSS